jgi:GNAT superfamily N-acetyltransferase
MESNVNPPVERACVNDAEGILKLQYLCYQSEAALYNDYSIPPLTQSLAELKAECAQSVVLVCRSGAEIIGAVRGRECQGRCCIGRLIVHPRMQRKGLGSKLMAAIEEAFPTVSAYDLFTGHRSEGNLRLYHRLGYRQYKVENAGPELQLVFLEKVRRPSLTHG